MKICMYILPWAAALLPISAVHVNDNDLLVAKTVTLSDGSIIDWVYPSSQGVVARPPSFPPFKEVPTNEKAAIDPEWKKEEEGPVNTVPVLRQRSNDELLPGLELLLHDKRFLGLGCPYKHWYAGTRQHVFNIGAMAVFSRFWPRLSSRRAMSVIQMAVARQAVPGVPGKKVQTLEAGWMYQPRMLPHPHLFTFFTVNSYRKLGHYKGGFNTKVKGWVQVDRRWYPGMMLPASQIGGRQKSLPLRFLLHRGNWWLAVSNRWIGYYPAQMFHRRGKPASRTLAGAADVVAMYGEVAQKKCGAKNTEMGSGRFAHEGWGRAAYIRRIKYTAMDGRNHNYQGPIVKVTDPSMYTCAPRLLSGNPYWQSYMYVGGPGK